MASATFFSAAAFDPTAAAYAFRAGHITRRTAHHRGDGLVARRRRPRGPVARRHVHALGGGDFIILGSAEAQPAPLVQRARRQDDGFTTKESFDLLERFAHRWGCDFFELHRRESIREVAFESVDPSTVFPGNRHRPFSEC
ncbi:MAG: hypothetical protein QM770_22575 [Tepidisphaeraceae bacterium]